MTSSYNWGRVGGGGGECPLAKLFIYRTSGVVWGGGGDSGSTHNGFSCERDWYLGKPSVYISRGQLPIWRLE